MIRSNTNGITARISSLFVLAAVLIVALSACTGFAAPGGQVSPGPAHLATDFRIVPEPAFDAVAVSPVQPVSLTVTDGTLTSLTLSNPAGKEVLGEFSEDRSAWRATEPLGFAKTYAWTGEAADADGERYPITGSFTTVAPAQRVSAQANVGDGGIYGIAMPISLTFTEKVVDKAAVERSLSVRTKPETQGAWGWLENDTAVHWRPAKYWKPGTEVHVEAAIYGVRTGHGQYGAQDIAVDFTIGRAQVVKADTSTHRMVVVRDGETVADYPASFGLDTDPVRVTRSGIHVVMAKHPTYLMNNARYDYENFEVRWAVRISNNGEFTHAAPWSVADQGVRNVSHGCVNLAPDAAKEYFDSALIGDPVEIVGSSQRLGTRDGAYHDWTFSWADWQKRSALGE